MTSSIAEMITVTENTAKYYYIDRKFYISSASIIGAKVVECCLSGQNLAWVCTIRAELSSTIRKDMRLHGRVLLEQKLA